MSTPDPVQRVLDAVKNIKPSGDGWSGRCSAHDDRYNSLTIHRGADGRALVKCHAGEGRPTERIVAALGLTMADLFPHRDDTTRGNGRSRQIVATYDYRNEAGTLLYQAVRYEPKGFSQRQPDGRGGWDWHLRGVRRVLYRLRELRAADPDAWVLLPEGEKDVERLRAAGFVATTNAMDAGKWQPDYAEHLRDRRVVLLPDNDAEGEAHVAKQGASLARVAREVRVLRLPGLPPKGDASDWFDAGGTPDELGRLVDAAPLWEPRQSQETTDATGDDEKGTAQHADSGSPRTEILTAEALAQKIFPDPRWAIPGVLPEGATLLVGAPKKGKSWLLLGLGIAIATAGSRALAKIAVEQGDVLLLCLEDSERRLQERLWRILDGVAAPERLHLVTEWPRLDEGGDSALDAWLKEHPATRLVGIDVLARLRPPSRDKGDVYQRDYETMAAFKRVADRHGVALVVVHHSRKAGAEDPLDLISGTNGLAAAADTALILTREKGRADGNLYVRGRDVPEMDYALGFDPVLCQWSLLRERGPMAPKAIAEALGADRGNIRVLLHRMAQTSEVINHGGVYALPPFEGVTGVTPPKTDATVPISPVTPPVTPAEGVTPPVTGKTGATTTISDPVTPVTPQIPRQRRPG